MKQNQSQSPLDRHRDDIQAYIDLGYSNAEIVRRLGEKGIETSRNSLNRAKRRWGMAKEPMNFERPGSTISADTAEVISEAVEDLTTPEEAVEQRGLSLDEWEIYDVTINEWDGMRADDQGILKQRQMKIKLRRIVPLEIIAPARLPAKKFEMPRRRKSTDRNPRFVVLVGDQQAPYHNKKLHKTFCAWLDEWRPDEGVLIGDTIDFPDISRHPDNPEQDATLQECIDSGYEILYEYRESSEKTHWQKLSGNHDERLRRATIDQFRKAYNIRRGKLPEEAAESPLLTVPHLLRLDELGIDYIDPDGDYEQAQVKLSPYLAARHGWIARKGSGASALATLEHLGYSVVVGHTHRQSLVHKTRHDINGELATFAACETGCMAEIEGGLGYAVTPDWQNGWATATIWPNGTFRLDLATYVDGHLYYRDQRLSV